jgi:5'-3' exonuclease
METKNRLTLLIDGNWFLLSRMFVIPKGFARHNSKIAKDAAASELQDMMARSISLMVSRNTVIDNIVIVADGGSWRKDLPIPKQLSDVTYKGNRTSQVELDWDAIYTAFEGFLESARNAGVTVSRGYNIEGDDWMWYWTRRLNADGINTLIWTSDCDLKQLVQVDNRSFTAWYNDKAGLVLPQRCSIPDDPMEYFMNPPFDSDILRKLVTYLRPVEYINPDEIAINKILCGDAGDNIKSVIRYKKGSRTYRFSQKDYNNLITETQISDMPCLVSRFEELADIITKTKKFQPYKFKPSDVLEMLEYNTKLVWLNERTIPDTVITKMAAEEYLVFDTSQLWTNYKVLLPPDSTIEDIFGGAQ